MGIASWALGDDNPFSKYVADNRQTLQGAFAGFGQGPSFGAGLSNAAIGAQRGTLLDDITRKGKAEEAKLAEQGNVTRSWLEQQGFTDLLPLVDAGETGLAYNEAFKRLQPGYGQVETVKPIEVNGQLVDPMTGQVIGDYRDANSGQPAAPSGYQWTPEGNQAFIPGGPADPATAGKTTEATRRNQQLASVIQPELATVEANWEELSSGNNQAANAAPFGAGYGLTSPGYQQATSALNTIAQSYLYSVSGAAAPAEEVRKLVESVTPRPFESPQSIADKKERVRQMAAAVVQAGSGSAQTQQPAGNVTSSGLQWSLEP